MIGLEEFIRREEIYKKRKLKMIVYENIRGLLELQKKTRI